MAAYIKQRHASNYIVYNLTTRQDLSMFEQVLDYGITNQTLPLDAAFLLCIEMAQWITRDPLHVVVMHESKVE